MTNEEIKFTTELAEHQFQDLPKNVFDIMHRPSFIAGFVRAIAVSQEALKIIEIGKTTWVYFKDVQPKKTGRYFVAEIVNGKPIVTTRKWYEKTKCWAGGRWKTAGNVYAWMMYAPPMREDKK